jgi:hypothetical protein
MQKRGRRGSKGRKLSTPAGDDDHLARLDLAHEFGADDVERAGLRRSA